MVTATETTTQPENAEVERIMLEEMKAQSKINVRINTLEELITRASLRYVRGYITKAQRDEERNDLKARILRLREMNSIVRAQGKMLRQREMNRTVTAESDGKGGE